MLFLYSVNMEAFLFQDLESLHIFFLKYHCQTYMSLYVNLCQNICYQDVAFQCFESLVIPIWGIY